MILAAVVLLVVGILLALELAEGGPEDWLDEEEAVAHLTESLGNVTVLPREGAGQDPAGAVASGTGGRGAAGQTKEDEP